MKGLKETLHFFTTFWWWKIYRSKLWELIDSLGLSMQLKHNYSNLFSSCDDGFWCHYNRIPWKVAVSCVTSSGNIQYYQSRLIWGIISNHFNVRQHQGYKPWSNTPCNLVTLEEKYSICGCSHRNVFMLLNIIHSKVHCLILREVQ